MVLKMEFETIKKYFGEQRLSALVALAKSLKWIEPPELRTEEYSKLGILLLEKIEEIIKKFEKIQGFNYWVREIRNSSYKDFQHFLFELMSLENLLNKSDNFELKPLNSINGKNSEALIFKGQNSFYVENTFLDDIPSNLSNKVSHLFRKSREKFVGGEGLHFIGAYHFFNYSFVKETPLPELKYLIKLIQEKFDRGAYPHLLAFVIVNIYFHYNPNSTKTSLPKSFIILPNPHKNISKDFFKGLFEVDEFNFVDSF
jgi:hypothetical protein